MNSKILAALGAVVMIALIAGSVYAYQAGNRYNASPLMDREAAQKALENGDYEAWKEIHANSTGRMSKLITSESDFQLLRQMHEARESGNFQRVQEIKAELGFTGNGKGRMQGMHKGWENGQRTGYGKGNCPYA